MCLGVLRLMTKDNKENKTTCLGEGVNLQLPEKKRFPMTTSADETRN